MSEQPSMTWHLADTKEDLKVIDFEFLFWRVYYSWTRWQEDCQSCIADDNLSATEIALLHIIRMKNRPKTIYELGRLLNRDDMPNIQYSVKKLINLGYVRREKISLGAKNKVKTIAYQITDAGVENTDTYTKARKDILLKILKEYTSEQLPFEEVTKTLSLMKGIYEEASRLTASYKNNNVSDNE